MRTLFLGLFMACLFNTSYGMGGFPPVITDGKLYGVLPIVNQKVTYSVVVDCGAVSQADVFRRARLWAAQLCQAPGDVVTLSDKETGDLVGRVSQVIVLPRSEQYTGGIYSFRYSWVIECTNRKYRATITQLAIEDGEAKPVAIEAYSQKNEIDVKALYVALDLQLKNKLTSLQESVANYKAF